MACGTPVLAFRQGSVPEIIDDHVTGRIVETVDEAIRLLPGAMRFDRRGVRRRFEERFSSARMADEYVQIYRKLHRSAAVRLTLPTATVTSIHSLNDLERHAT